MEGDHDKASFWKKNIKNVPGRYDYIALNLCHTFIVVFNLVIQMQYHHEFDLI